MYTEENKIKWENNATKMFLHDAARVSQGLTGF